MQKYVQKRKQKNYVQDVKTVESLNEPEVRKISLPPPKFGCRILRRVAGRRIPE